MGSSTAPSTFTTQSTSSGATPQNRKPATPAFDFNPCEIIDRQIDPERRWIFRTGHLFARRHNVVLSLIDYTA
jgi:hypothetical protein